MSLNAKRDRIQVLAEILGTCRSPQTQTYIRRHTSISYSVLQSCLVVLLLRRWITEVETDNGQRKLVTTEKGLAFLEKWLELQKLTGIKSQCTLHIFPLELKAAKLTCR